MALEKFVNIQFVPALKRNELRRLKIPGPAVPDPEELFFLKEGTVGVLALLLLLLLPPFKSV